MTKLRIEGTPFHAPAVERDLCRAFMSCILSYQSARRSHYLKHLYTSKTEILPEAAAKQVESLGVLDLLTGALLEVVGPAGRLVAEYAAHKCSTQVPLDSRGVEWSALYPQLSHVPVGHTPIKAHEGKHYLVLPNLSLGVKVEA